ncbi:polysaccharide pyruvyl transferase family protein [Bacteroides gallinaceum]|uniref:polysaccharide pyruvyl transferase family protein n=1 Tax=Bacteroides gallinaceum TaxID=1462571 RepID=UPI001EF6FAEE|nr:polysaccharide pyruvyl transferase family protein [Bacteroides gallinaceum]
MKIKLVTFAPHPNFGTCLQGYALNYVLRKMGHDVEFIYNGRESHPQPFIKAVTKKCLESFLPKSFIASIKAKRQANMISQRKEPYILELPNHPVLYQLSKLPFYEKVYKMLKCRNLQWKKVYKFTHEDGNFNMRRIYTHQQYAEVTAETDLFITGSDQIWNPYCGGFNPMMFVEFGGNKKRVAYSSSISLPEIPASVKQRMKRDLEKFQHIAVREQRSVELLNKLLHRNDIKLVVDPTYLLSAKEWEEFGNKAEIEFTIPEKYIFCYFVGDKRADVYEQMVQEVKHFTGIQNVITLECYNRTRAYGGGRLYKDAGPYEWVYLLRHASYVCMDSFHATVFALKFQKEFVHAMKNADTETGSQNTRMYDILSRYGILYKNYNADGSTGWQQRIDYARLTPLIESEIKDSMDYLKYEIEN